MTLLDPAARALNDAATSLETIASLSGRETFGDPPIETYMQTFMRVRGYAASRARAAREVLAELESIPAARVEPIPGGVAESEPSNLRAVVRAHIADLRRTAEMLRAEFPQFASPMEFQRAADELEAALAVSLPSSTPGLDPKRVPEFDLNGSFPSLALAEIEAERARSTPGLDPRPSTTAHKAALLVLCALEHANDWHPNMQKDIAFAIDATRVALGVVSGLDPIRSSDGEVKQ